LSRFLWGRGVRWAVWSALLAGGALVQVACVQSAADLTTSIANAFIRNLVSEVLDLETGFRGFF